MARKLFSSALITLTVLLVAAGVFAAPTNKPPTVTAFDVAANSAPPVPVLAFTATDSDGSVTGYLITETSTKPSASAAGWSATAPTQYTTSTVGTVVLYGWAKDNKDAVSNSQSDTVVIPPPPIDADTVDGKHASEFAAAVHGHAMTDVTGLNSALAGKADVGHNHDFIYQKKYANVVVVAKSGGDFADPIAAMSSITDASAENPYLLKIMPGVYDLGSNTLYMKEHVDIEGAGEDVTLLNSVAAVTMLGANSTEVRYVTVTNTTTGPAGYAIKNEDVSIRLANLTAMSSGAEFCSAISNGYLAIVAMTNVTATASGPNTNWGVMNTNASVIMTNSIITANGIGANTNHGIHSFYSSISLVDTTVTASAGVYEAWGLHFDNSSLSMTGSVVSAKNATLNYGITAFNDTGIVIDRSTVEGTTCSIKGWFHMKIGASKLVGRVDSSSGGYTCVASYDGDYAPLDANCQ